MSMILIKCPNKGEPISTGIDTDANSFKQLPDVSLRVLCPLCGLDHVWRIREGWLADQPTRLVATTNRPRREKLDKTGWQSGSFVVPSEAEKYLQYWRECSSQALRAETPQHRDKLLELARVWLEAARNEEKYAKANANSEPKRTSMLRR